MRGKLLLTVLLAPVLPAFAQIGGMPLLLRDPLATPAPPPPSPAAIPGSPLPADQRRLIQHYGTVVDERAVGVGGLTAWTVEKDGRRVLLYSTADGQALIHGSVWDAATGRNVSDQLVTLAARVDALPGSPSSGLTKGALSGLYSGLVPQSIQTIDALSGVREGHGGAADTLYVIFDPRCPYCREAFALTRDYVKHGATIKWIPALVLPNPSQGIPLAATVLQAPPQTQEDVLQRVLGNKEEIRSTALPATQAALTRNLEFFFAAFRNSRAGAAGVPAAFFLDHRSGQPRMITGLSQPAALQSVFGTLP
jgi:thiol:disulfide interchange protein DsbG